MAGALRLGKLGGMGPDFPAVSGERYASGRKQGPRFWLKNWSFLFALLCLVGMPVLGGEPLETLLQKRTLDVVTPKERTLAGALSELAARYKAKYGDELPVFISVDLLPNANDPKPKTEPPPIIPGTDPPERLKIDPSELRLEIPLSNVPLVEILHFYAGLSNAAFTIRGDVILFYKPK